MKQPNLSLTQEQIDFFHREGYLVIPAITTPEEVQSLCDIYDHIFSSKAGRDQGDHLDLTSVDDGSEPEMLPQILSPSKYAPELSDTLFRSNAEVIAGQLLGPETVFKSDHAIRKPPQSGAATPWHQDEAYWSENMEYNALSIWIPLQEATLENGCMQFVPGSHKQDVLPHHSIGNDPRIIGLEVDDADTFSAKAVPCPIPAGGATVHFCRTLHYTSPNRSDGPRRAYILDFKTPQKEREAPRDFYWLKMQRTKWHERAEGSRKVKTS